MRVVLLYPLPGGVTSSGVVERMPTLSLYLLAAVLRAKGHDVALADVPGAAEDAGSLRALVRDAEAVGVSANSFSWATALATVRRLRSDFPALPIVLGGIHPTYFDEHCLEVSGADFVLRGEGEVSLPALLDALAGRSGLANVPGLTASREALDRLADIPGLTASREALDRLAGASGHGLAGGGRVYRTPEAALLDPAELERLPAPAYDLTPAGRYRAATVQTSRGCVYECAFCSIPHRRGWRPLGVNRCLELVEAAVAQADRFAHPGAVYFLDDCFTTDGARATKLLTEMNRRGLRPHLGLEARANHLTPPVVEAIAKLPCWLIQIGVECGYPEGLKRVAKGITLADVEAAAARLRESGLIEHAVFSFILGLPWETVENCVTTLTYALQLALRYGAPLSLSWYEPFPGSRIWGARAGYGADVGPEVFDGPGDWRVDPGLFKAFRPLLDWDDCRRLEELVADLARIIPRYLGLFQTRVPRDGKP